MGDRWFRRSDGLISCQWDGQIRRGDHSFFPWVPEDVQKACCELDVAEANLNIRLVDSGVTIRDGQFAEGWHVHSWVIRDGSYGVTASRADKAELKRFYRFEEVLVPYMTYDFEFFERKYKTERCSGALGHWNGHKGKRSDLLLRAIACGWGATWEEVMVYDGPLADPKLVEWDYTTPHPRQRGNWCLSEPPTKT